MSDKLIMFVNDLCRHWEVVSPGDSRNPNHILGLVCRHYYPGIVTHKGTVGPAKTWDHYKSAPDIDYGDKQERVRREFWVSLVCTTLINTSYSFDFFDLMN
jgi:hypothetical protein